MSISPMFCAVFLALLGLALAGPIDFEADLKPNVDLGSLQKDRLKNPAADEAEIELLEATEEHLVEGDILPTNAQLALIGTFHKSNRSRRQAIKDERYSWGSVNPVIPYNFSATYPKETRGPIITAAMKFWEKNTCVRFKEVTSGYRVEIEDWEHIQDGAQCSSQVGKEKSFNGMQYLFLGKGCMTLGIICHELMHTFGFDHVQKRFDRDQYIDIDFENVENNFSYNTVEEDEHVLHGIPYEFGSVMHYAHKDKAKNSSQPALYAKSAYKIYQESMQGRMPTFYDILAVNRHFNCSAKCKTPVECFNGGVQDVNNCKNCLCPSGWTGHKCKKRPNNTTQIAVTSELMTKIISINSNIPSTTEYNAPAGMKVQMTPRVVGNRHRDKACSLMGIEVKFLRNQSFAGLQVCNMDVKYPTITSETNVMFVQAYTLGEQFDVQLQYIAVKSPEKCEISVSCANGGVQDLNNCNKCVCPVGWIGNMCDIRPEYTELFANTNLKTKRIGGTVGKYKIKYYLIKAPDGMKVQMTPEVLATRAVSSCSSMGIEVKYLEDQRPAGLRVCEWQERPTITSETNEMLVQIYTLPYTQEELLSAVLQFKAVNSTEKCKTSVACANGGVPDVNVCNKCICPLGSTGFTCEKRPEHTRLFAKNNPEKMKIRMPLGPTTIQHRVEYYLITAPGGMKIQMTPRVSAQYSKSCDRMGLKVVRDQLSAEIRVRNPTPPSLHLTHSLSCRVNERVFEMRRRVCGSTAKQPTITSDTNEMLVQAYTMEHAFVAQLEFKAVN